MVIFHSYVKLPEGNIWKQKTAMVTWRSPTASLALPGRKLLETSPRFRHIALVQWSAAVVFFGASDWKNGGFN